MIRGIFSGKGGVGKTTVTVNLAIALTLLKEEIIAIDGDLRNPNMIIHLGSLDHGKSLQEIIEKDGPLLEGVYTHPTGLKFVPTHLSLKYLDTDLVKLKNVLTSGNYNIIVDSPPGLTSESIGLLNICDEIIIVSQPLMPDITDCMKTIEVAREINKKVLGIIINKRRNKSYELTNAEISAVCNAPILAEIPWDEDFLHALKLKSPIVVYKPKSRASIQFFKLAAMLSGKDYQEPKMNVIEKVIGSIRKIGHPR